MNTHTLRDFDLYAFDQHEPTCRVELHDAPPIIRRIWKNVLWEIERNYVIETAYGTVYAAGDRGEHFIAKLFNRDVAFSGLLGLNALYPDSVMQSLKIIRKIRLERGWSCPRSHVIDGIDSVQVEDMDNLNYIMKYGKSTPLNKTDDVVWMWCYYDLLMRGQFSNKEWKWFYETGLTCFERLYEPFFDSDDGLYFGQPTFIDVGSNGYPEEMQKNSEITAANRCVWVKSPSTNTLYYAGLKSMEETARKLGKHKEALTYGAKAEALAMQIRKKLRFANGTFCYFMHKNGSLEQRREAMSTALPVLLDIVVGEDARVAVADYPYTVWGAPLFTPYFDNDAFYHNNSAWPFASSFLSTAIEKATEISTAFENLVMLMNCFEKGSFREVFDMRTREATGCYSQLWSLAAFVHTCARMKYTPFGAELNPFTNKRNG